MRWQYPDELEADFQQYYGLDVLNTEQVSPAKAARLLFQLPRECRVFTKVAPAAQWGWDQILANKTNYLLELLVWMKTKDAQKKQPQNKPTPFVPEFLAKADVDVDTEAHTAEEITEILGRARV